MKSVLPGFILVALLLISCRKDAKLIEGSIEFVETIGKPGTQLGEFNFVSSPGLGWAAEHDGNYLYIADSDNHRVQRFNSDNSVKDWWGYLNGKLGFHTESEAADDNLDPTKIIYKNQHLYIPSYINYEYQLFKIDLDGNLIYNYPIKFSNYASFCVDNDDNTFVYIDDDIFKYDSIGNLVQTFAGFGIKDGKLKNDGYTIQIVIDENDFIYAIDAGNNRIQKYNNKGDFIKNWGVGATLGYASMYYFDQKLYIKEDDFLNAYNANGELVSKWKDNVLHKQLQIIITKNKIFEPDPHNQNIKVFEFKE